MEQACKAIQELVFPDFLVSCVTILNDLLHSSPKRLQGPTSIMAKLLINIPLSSGSENTKLLTDMITITTQDLDHTDGPLMELTKYLMSLDHENKKSGNKQWQLKHQPPPLLHGVFFWPTITRAM
eukprot:TRINITY_DN28136_c0_g1_i1.p1 TRINITY_DN28136_c0_g1~~TRINITY_DN28136_c0_g1_i1.p1  ORF type:complete len:125 (-),score=22.55 TRINITY_DN28136_c0_g1_i1:253-627(-)